MASKKVNIVDNTNEVSVTNSNNKIEIVNTNTPSNIEVTQRTTTLVQVKTAGPKGDRGPIGPAVVQTPQNQRAPGGLRDGASRKSRHAAPIAQHIVDMIANGRAVF